MYLASRKLHIWPHKSYNSGSPVPYSVMSNTTHNTVTTRSQQVCVCVHEISELDRVVKTVLNRFVSRKQTKQVKNASQTPSDFYQQVIIAILYRENISSSQDQSLFQIKQAEPNQSIDRVFYKHPFKQSCQFRHSGTVPIVLSQGPNTFSRAQVSYIPLRLKITLFFVPLCFAS